jgi:hypothetical protein
MTQYTKTITVQSPLCFDSLKPGQWFVWAGAGRSRGQYYGTTRAGVDVVRHQQGAWGKPSDTARAATLRAYALRHGSK